MGVALEEVRTNWDALGRDNPLWAIRSDRADWDVDDFFAAGRKEIDEVFAEEQARSSRARNAVIAYQAMCRSITRQR